MKLIMNIIINMDIDRDNKESIIILYIHIESFFFQLSLLYIFFYENFNY